MKKQATVVELADAVVAAINSASLPEPLPFKRRFIHLWELEDGEDIKASVIPRSDDGGALASRSDMRHEYAVDVAVSRRVAGVDDEWIEKLLLATEMVDDLFRFNRITLINASGMEFRPINRQSTFLDPEQLHDRKLFTFISKLTFAAYRE